MMIDFTVSKRQPEALLELGEVERQPKPPKLPERRNPNETRPTDGTGTWPSRRPPPVPTRPQQLPTTEDYLTAAVSSQSPTSSKPRGDSGIFLSCDYNCDSTTIRLQYDDTTTHSTTKEVIEIMICVRFDCDTTTTRLRRKIDMFIFCSRRMETGAHDTSQSDRRRIVSLYHNCVSTTTRLRYDDTTTHSTTTEVIEIMICVRFDCDTTTIRLRRIMRACFHSTRFNVSKK